MKSRIMEVWKNKGLILEGVTNTWFKTAHVEAVAEERLLVCRSNSCGFYDEHGIMASAYFPGQESCGLCGCKMAYKVRSMSSACTLGTIEQKPLWYAIMNEAQEIKFKEQQDQ